MEFPDLGSHCSEPTCNRLDFLPVKCDACGNIYCHTHMTYVSHNCKQGKSRDFQVPVCPLCNNPVPSKRGEAPDIAVGAHLDNDCQSGTAKNRRGRVFANKCSLKTCNQKEMIPLLCTQCEKNYCIKHRHPTDHSCTRRKPSHKTKPAHQPPTSGGAGKVREIQGSMSEDEALARALALSMNETPAQTRNNNSCHLS